MDLFDLSGKPALVTGASRGLGRTFARALARAGADVAITSRTLAVARRATHGDRRRSAAAPCRSSSTSAMRPASAAGSTPRNGSSERIDILVNNAGCNVRKPAVDVTWDDWNTVLETNLRGAFFVAQAVART